MARESKGYAFVFVLVPYASTRMFGALFGCHKALAKLLRSEYGRVRVVGIRIVILRILYGAFVLRPLAKVLSLTSFSILNQVADRTVTDFACRLIYGPDTRVIVLVTSLSG